MTSPPLSIILLNFNGATDTLECLESLRNAQLDDAAVILIDNGSSDDSVERLLAWNKHHQFFRLVSEGLKESDKNDFSAPLSADHEHTLLLSTDNLGFAGGNNLGARLALARGGREVLLLNNDTTVAPDFLIPLRAVAQDQPEAVLIPQIRLYHQPDRLWNCGGELRWPGRKVYNYQNTPVADLPIDELLPVTFVTGCALWYRPTSTGLLTERFFFGEEDMEFSLRLRDREIKAYCVTGSVIYHKVGSTLENNFRKSEIFTLKRLVNMRTRSGALLVICAYTYYLLNLLRLLVLNYKVRPHIALAKVIKVARASLRIDEVGQALCVAYVRGEDIEL